MQLEINADNGGRPSSVAEILQMERTNLSWKTFEDLAIPLHHEFEPKDWQQKDQTTVSDPELRQDWNHHRDES
jgi:hypothetical protein